jgi:hypothetical protein
MHPDADLTEQGVAGILADFLEALDLEDVTLVLNDWGGGQFMISDGRDKRLGHGSHRSGIEHAREDLFEGAACVVTEAPDAALRERVCAFWRALGARVVLRDAASHDAEVAWMSHLPHALAFAFASSLRSAPERAFEVAGAGFRDFTRIAHSEPELWAEILGANRKALAAPLQAAAQALAELGRAIESNEVEALERYLGAARAALSRGEVRGSDPAIDDDANPRRPQRPGGARRNTRS